MCLGGGSSSPAPAVSPQPSPLIIEPMITGEEAAQKKPPPAKEQTNTQQVQPRVSVGTGLNIPVG